MRKARRRRWGVVIVIGIVIGIPFSRKGVQSSSKPGAFFVAVEESESTILESVFGFLLILGGWSLELRFFFAPSEKTPREKGENWSILGTKMGGKESGDSLERYIVDDGN